MIDFKVGDRVKDLNSREGVIKNTRAIGSFGMDLEEYEVEYPPIAAGPVTRWHYGASLKLSTWDILDSPKEEQLELPVDQPVIECDCGQKFTRHGGLHSDWCKINK